MHPKLHSPNLHGQHLADHPNCGCQSSHDIKRICRLADRDDVRAKHGSEATAKYDTHISGYRFFGSSQGMYSKPPHVPDMVYTCLYYIIVDWDWKRLFVTFSVFLLSGLLGLLVGDPMQEVWGSISSHSSQVVIWVWCGSKSGNSQS